ncbi:MAG: phosphoribosyl-ATP diphosphatase [Leptothrix sp. (in: Bacteria)]|nr:phosphoribosyl-ATP diphosphatase [Leptothrix sp. (in: b-proteobacteria)]
MPHRAPQLLLSPLRRHALGHGGAGAQRPRDPLQVNASEGPSVNNGNDTLARLAEVIESRRGQAADKSYVARLFSKGNDAILKKVGEEATEVVMAAKDGDRRRIVGEVADLWFHTLVALAAYGLKPADVLAELERREGMSGLEEFALRKLRDREGDTP